MCGLFGFLGSGADPEVLKELAALAARRGPDAFGFLASLEDERVICRRTGHPVNHLAYLDEAAGAQMVIGHCRLATSQRIEAAIQPLIHGKTAVAHNGNVYNAPALARDYALDLVTGNDSEVIAALIDKAAEGSLIDRLQWTVDQLQSGGMAVLTIRPQEYAAYSAGLPLYSRQTDQGRYFCSVRPNEDWLPLKYFTSQPPIHPQPEQEVV